MNTHTQNLHNMCIMVGKRPLLKMNNIDLDLQGHSILLLISERSYITLFAQ